MRPLLFVCLSVPILAASMNDEAYTAKIHEYTTEPYFSTELVDHLPASATVPTPEKVLGYVIGTPNKLTYTKDIYRYMRELEKASPRVKVFSIGKSEEGRETLLVAVSDAENIRRLDRYREMNARLADPRKTSDADAKQIIAEDIPMYWATGSIHSPETGSPEMLMELAYRLAVEDSPVINNIRKNMIVLITPCTEVDGRDKEVDVYNYQKANPDKPAPSLVYWGHYVAHDNNRDGIGMALQLSKIVMKTFLDWHPAVLHDLHESVPFLYVSTGMGPYNAWIDPILADEWFKMAMVEVEEMTKRGVPGVWTYGYYDGWAPNYMFYAANGHNAIGRFYETFGGHGADTGERTVPASSTSRTWYRPNPPLPKVNWSIRDNINLQQSAILLAMNNTATNGKTFLENFYLKSKRAVAKSKNEGPAEWIIPTSERPLEAAQLVAALQLQGIEVHQRQSDGAYVVRMDQPYSRMADMLLDTQYYNVNDPPPYDDTGWTMGAMRNVKTVRVTDVAVLNEPMTLLKGAPKPEGRAQGSGSVYILDHNAENALATFRFKLKDVKMSAAEEPFTAGGHQFHAGAFIIRPENRKGEVDAAIKDLGLHAYLVDEEPRVSTHPLATPRIALVHSWLNTQSEGWYRIAFDQLSIPYEYISDQKLRQTPNLRAQYDVILFGPTPGNSRRVVNGLPMRGSPIPWKQSALTPNLGLSPDTTDDMRGGMGLDGLVNIGRFIDEGGLFITITNNDSIPIDYGLVDGISISTTRDLKARGSVLNTKINDRKSPIVYGYGDSLAVYFNQAPVLNVSLAAAMGLPPPPMAEARPSGRGSLTDPDIPQGRPYVAPPIPPRTVPGEEPPIDEETRRYMGPFLPTRDQLPRVVMRFADERDLLISGMLSGGRELAGHPAIVDAPRGKGHIVMFANNPMWRNETQGSYFLLFNAMLNFDHLGVGVPKAKVGGDATSGQ